MPGLMPGNRIQLPVASSQLSVFGRAGRAQESEDAGGQKG
jgi:hypothetical protein